MFLNHDCHKKCMKITVDTKEDSYEEIRKAIKFLQHVIEANEELSSPEQPEPAGNVFGLFDSQPSEPEQQDEDNYQPAPDREHKTLPAPKREDEKVVYPEDYKVEEY